MENQIVIGVIVGISVAVAAQVISTFSAKRKNITTNTISNVEMKTDIKYIREKVDDMKTIPSKIAVLEEAIKEIKREIEAIKRGNC